MGTPIKVVCPLCSEEAKFIEIQGDELVFICTGCDAMLSIALDEGASKKTSSDNGSEW